MLVLRHHDLLCGCAALGRLLKKAIHQVRPVGTCEALGICDKPGMPSSHCQVIFYLLGLELLRSCHRSFVCHQNSWQLFSQLSLLVIYTAASVMVAYSRVYLGYHDVAQVVAGAAAGLSVAAACFAVTCIAARCFPTWQRLHLARLLRIKDTWPINDVLLFEYDNTLTKSKKS